MSTPDTRAVHSSGRVAEIIAAAHTLGSTAAILDPHSETVYHAHFPLRPIEHPSVWWMGISGWLSFGSMSWFTRQLMRPIPTIPVWYCASHQHAPAQDYYVDAIGTLYVSAETEVTIPGRIAVTTLSQEALAALPTDDLEDILMQIRRQRVWQEHYRSRQ